MHRPCGVSDDGTVRANREGYQHVQLRPRRLRDATKVDMHVDLFGTMYNAPIFTCPTGGEKSFFSEGELAVARAAKARGTLQILSTSTSTPPEEVNKALGRPVWVLLPFRAHHRWMPPGPSLRDSAAGRMRKIVSPAHHLSVKYFQTAGRVLKKEFVLCCLKIYLSTLFMIVNKVE